MHPVAAACNIQTLRQACGGRVGAARVGTRRRSCRARRRSCRAHALRAIQPTTRVHPLLTVLRTCRQQRHGRSSSTSRRALNVPPGQLLVLDGLGAHSRHRRTLNAFARGRAPLSPCCLMSCMSRHGNLCEWRRRRPPSARAAAVGWRRRRLRRRRPRRPRRPRRLLRSPARLGTRAPRSRRLRAVQATSGGAGGQETAQAGPKRPSVAVGRGPAPRAAGPGGRARTGRPAVRAAWSLDQPWTLD